MAGVSHAVPRIKICGLTTPEAAEHAAEAGAWAVGMVFWPGSPRAVSVQTAADIAGPLRRRTELVGLFVDATLDEVVGTAEAVGLTWVQLHGHEGPSFCEAVARRAGVKVIKAARVRARADVQAIDAFRNVDAHLLDHYRPGVPGGTGETFDWALDGRAPLRGPARPGRWAHARERRRGHRRDAAVGRRRLLRGRARAGGEGSRSSSRRSSPRCARVPPPRRR